MEWNGVPRHLINGKPLGYNINVYTNGSWILSTSVDYFTTAQSLDSLLPSMKYTLEVCAYNAIGNGPCERVSGSTLDSGTWIT